jgi:nucleotide-binding universal stress UspA family protein
MSSIRRILCATDFSEASTPAWSFAIRLARATSARLSLLHVVPFVPLPIEGAIDAQTYQQLLEDDRRDALQKLEALVRERAGGVAADVRVEDGPPAPRILDVAERDGADLVVVGTHGRAGLDRLLLGSVAEHVVQLARRPVVTVRPGSAGVEGSGLGRILFPTDFSDTAQQAWPWVRALADATGAAVELLHVVRAVVTDQAVDPAILARAAELIRQDAHRQADAFIAGCGLPAGRVVVHVASGVEAEQIAHFAAARRVDLVAMGTHGRTGLVRLALGSVTRRVLHQATCPVLTVGPEVPPPPTA